MVVLDRDAAEVFPTASDVNRALRKLIAMGGPELPSIR